MPGLDLWKVLSSFGETGLVLFIIYRLVSKWASAFLNAQTDQAKAMAQQASAIVTLATSVQASQADQRDVVIAVRVLAEKIEQQSKSLRLIEEGMREAIRR